jgi:hypothetical protein
MAGVSSWSKFNSGKPAQYLPRFHAKTDLYRFAMVIKPCGDAKSLVMSDPH